MGVGKKGAIAALVIALITVLVILSAPGSSADNENNTVYVEETGTYYETLEEAVISTISKGFDSVTITLTAEKTYEINFSSLGCDLSITGQGKNTVVHKINNIVYAHANTVTFKDLTLRTDGGSYCGFQVKEEKYQNVQIEKTLWTYGKSSVFENCTFVSEENLYGLWCYGTDYMIIDNCVFNSIGKAVLIYNEGSNNTNVEIRNTVFNDSAEPGKYKKAAVEIHTQHLPGYNVAIDNCIANGFSDEGSCKNNLWNACENKDEEEKSISSLIVVDGFTKLFPENVKATIVNENGTKRFVDVEGAFSAAYPGDTLILLELEDEVKLPTEFNKNIIICGTKKEDETNGYKLTQLTVGNTIPASAYVRLNIVSSVPSITAKGVVRFEECTTTLAINPEEKSAIIDDAVFDDYWEVIAGIVTVADSDGKENAKKELAEGCILGDPIGDTYKVLCTIILDLGDGVEDKIYVAYGEELSKLEKIPEKSGYVFDGLFLGEVQYYDSNGNSLVGISDLKPKTVLTAKWTSSPDPPTPPVSRIIVSYDENGGSLPGPTSVICNPGEKITVKNYTGTKQGYAFGGWSYGGKTYQPGDVVTTGSSDITFTAVWNPNPVSADTTVAVVLAVVVIFLAFVCCVVYFMIKK